MDTTTASGEFAFHILGAMAHFERRVIGERTRAGMASAKARGVRLGRPPKLTAPQTADAKARLTKGKTTVAELAAELNVSPATLARALTRLEATA
jgi:DNA invertase Pin-like site-specific DNA recombinase